ncbi:MAG: type II secretion system F family protein [Kiritimatiellia bacterium]
MLLETGPVLIPALFLLCFGGLAWVLGHSMRDASEQYASVYMTETARELENLFLFIPPQRLIVIARLAAIGSFAVVALMATDFNSPGGMFRGLFLGAMAGGGMLMLPRTIVRRLRAKRLLAFNTQLVDALVAMSNALRAGFSIQQAFESIVKEGKKPIAQEFSVFLQQMRIGVRFEDALRNLDERVGSEDLTLMIRAVEIARQTGGNLTETFDRIAETIRERTRIEGRIRALTAMGRLQGIVVGLIPIFLLMVLTVMDPKMMMNFYGSTTGVMLLGLMVLLEGVGFLVIKKIVNIRV